MLLISDRLKSEQMETPCNETTNKITEFELRKNFPQKVSPLMTID